MTKKTHQKFWQMKIEKLKFGKLSPESENFLENRGESETGECIIASEGDGCPWLNKMFEMNYSSCRPIVNFI